MNFSELNLRYHPTRLTPTTITVLTGSEADLRIYSFNTDLGTFGLLFTFGVITSFAVVKGSLKKQCCNRFLCCLHFLEWSADLKTCILFFNSFMRQTITSYLFSYNLLFMTFAKSFILLQTSVICSNWHNGFLIFFFFVTMPNKLKASSYWIFSSSVIFFLLVHILVVVNRQFFRAFHFTDR